MRISSSPTSWTSSRCVSFRTAFLFKSKEELSNVIKAGFENTASPRTNVRSHLSGCALTHHSRGDGRGDLYRSDAERPDDQCAIRNVQRLRADRWPMETPQRPLLQSQRAIDSPRERGCNAEFQLQSTMTDTMKQQRQAGFLMAKNPPGWRTYLSAQTQRHRR